MEAQDRGSGVIDDILKPCPLFALRRERASQRNDPADMTINLVQPTLVLRREGGVADGAVNRQHHSLAPRQRRNAQAPPRIVAEIAQQIVEHRGLPKRLGRHRRVQRGGAAEAAKAQRYRRPGIVMQEMLRIGGQQRLIPPVRLHRRCHVVLQ